MTSMVAFFLMERGFQLHPGRGIRDLITTQHIKANKVFKIRTTQDLIVNDEAHP